MVYQHADVQIMSGLSLTICKSRSQASKEIGTDHPKSYGKRNY